MRTPQCSLQVAQASIAGRVWTRLRPIAVSQPWGRGTVARTLHLGPETRSWRRKAPLQTADKLQRNSSGSVCLSLSVVVCLCHGAKDTPMVMVPFLGILVVVWNPSCFSWPAQSPNTGVF